MTDICRMYLLLCLFALSAFFICKTEDRKRRVNSNHFSEEIINCVHLNETVRKTYFFENKRFWGQLKRLLWLYVKKQNTSNIKFLKFPFFVCGFTMTEMCRMRSSSLLESLAGSSVGSGMLRPPSWWWMWKSSVPFSSHCCLQRTRGMSSEFPEISARHKPDSWWDVFCSHGTHLHPLRK